MQNVGLKNLQAIALAAAKFIRLLHQELCYFSEGVYN